jgi:hypothetical protein
VISRSRVAGSGRIFPNYVLNLGGRSVCSSTMALERLRCTAVRRSESRSLCGDGEGRLQVIAGNRTEGGIADNQASHRSDRDSGYAAVGIGDAVTKSVGRYTRVVRPACWR